MIIKAGDMAKKIVEELKRKQERELPKIEKELAKAERHLQKMREITGAAK